MATNELHKLLQLIDALNIADRQKLVQYLVGDATMHNSAEMSTIPGRADRLLEAAERMAFSSGQTDTSERSREILS
jgi:hypothetical protein